MHALDEWQDARAVVLSCPGALRRHAAALLTLDQARLTQVFLGGESQLLAFAAAFRPLREKLFFAPLPEMFSAAARRACGWGVLGEAPVAVHLRFGSVRDARLLKGVRNIAVVAEAPVGRPAAWTHPFAPGDVLPAAMDGVLTYAEAGAKPTAFGGAALPQEILPAGCVTADLAGAPADLAGLDLVSLGGYDSAAWAAGETTRGKAGGDRCVLVPWNLAHLGGIVPALLARLAAFADGAEALPMIVLLPFNDLGQTGIVRCLIKRLGELAARPDALLERIWLARATSAGGIAALRRLASLAWVDGGDPEAWWTVARLQAAGFAPLVLGAARGDVATFPADDSQVLEQETRFGTLRFEARLPALRDMPGLLATLDAPRRARSGRRA